MKQFWKYNANESMFFTYAYGITQTVESSTRWALSNTAHTHVRILQSVIMSE